jgi:hypothetical protein
MRRPILLADVRLELDDPPDPPAGDVIAHEARAEQRARRVEGRLGEEVAREGRAGRQATGWT